MRRLLLLTFVVAWSASLCGADGLQLLQLAPDPYGYPRPAREATNVPVHTSFFFQIGFADAKTTDVVVADSISVRIRSPKTAEIELLSAGQRFADGCTGKIEPSREPQAALAVYIDGVGDLQPATTYTVSVEARSRGGASLNGEKGSWQFTTAAAETVRTLQFPLDLSASPIRWQGGFFTGFCKPSFCTSAANRIPEYELMQNIRRESPRAWSIQRDFSPTSAGHQPEFLDWSHPNVVRERETRRIVAIEQRSDGMWLRIEDFFGHEQYGIAAGRPLADDYHPGDAVLIADGVSAARANVLQVVADTANERAVLVSPFDAPAVAWKIEYARPLPTAEDPHAPGLFPYGGCYLRKYRPVGTPHYYWGRLDKEWDIACRQFHRRLVVNFTDAPGDLAVDGRQWTYPKDYVEYHEVVRAYTSHLIERYGDACLGFIWSVFNEPDLAAAFWRGGDWIELQKFYDYTVDAILRSFEDHGYDSHRVIVGGLEIGGIFGTHIEGPILKSFLGHCSPTATCDDELEQNAALADPRLDGLRSQRVEDLGRATGGKGSPCDFISVHSYNAAPMMAAKLRRAKELALEVDADYYKDVWVSSFESCPNWAPPPDVAAADSYLGNGYFSTWCADVARRRLAAAAEDARYGCGETLLTFWPWPNSNFRGHNNATQTISVDDDGDGKKDREESLALPILRFLGLLARMGDDYWVLPEQTVGGHTVSGFASSQDDALFVLVYTHDPYDVQARSRAEFDISLDVSHVPWSEVSVREYRFDKDHNSYFHAARELRDRPANARDAKRPSAEEANQILGDLASRDRDVQLAAVRKAASFSDLPQAVLVAALQLHESTHDEDIRTAIEEAGRRIIAQPQCFAAQDVARVKELSELHVTNEFRVAASTDRTLHLPARVSANGANFLVIEAVK